MPDARCKITSMNRLVYYSSSTPVISFANCLLSGVEGCQLHIVNESHASSLPIAHCQLDKHARNFFANCILPIANWLMLATNFQ